MLECRYKGQCRIEYDTDFDVCYPCIGDWGDTCARYEPMPDVDALRAMADELSGDVLDVPAVYGTYLSGYVAACQDVARRIREALGVES